MEMLIALNNSHFKPLEFEVFKTKVVEIDHFK
jgi:hypothetical protein